MESEGLSEGQDTLGFSWVKPTGHLKHPAPGPRTFCCQSTTTPAAGPFLICVTVLAKYCSRSSSWAMQSILSTGEGDDGTPPVFRNAWQRSAAAQWRPPPQNRASVLKPSQAGRTNPPGQSSNRLICPPSDGMIQALPGGERGGTARPRFCNPRPSTRPGRPSSGPPLGPWVSFRCSRCRSVAGTHTAPGLGLTAGGAGGRHRLHACPGAWLFLKKIRRRLSCAGGAGLAAGTATLHEYFLDQYFVRCL